MIGISVEGDAWLDKVVGIVQGIEDTNVYALIVGVGTFVLIRVLRESRRSCRCPDRADRDDGLVAVFGWAERGVSVLGAVSAGLPRLGIPQVGLADYVRLLPGAIAICGITLADGLLVARNYAEKRDYPMHAESGVVRVRRGERRGRVERLDDRRLEGSRTAAMDGRARPASSRAWSARAWSLSSWCFSRVCWPCCRTRRSAGSWRARCSRWSRSAACASCTTRVDPSSWWPRVPADASCCWGRLRRW